MPDQRTARAGLVFSISAAWIIFVGLVAIALPADRQPLVFVLSLVGPALLLAVLLATLIGFANRRPWAFAAATPLLVTLLVTGVASFVIAVVNRRIEVPILPLLALWALLGRREPDAAGPWRPASMALVAGVLLAVLSPVAVQALLAPGGPLVTSEADLVQSIELQCVDGAEPGEAVRFIYRWSWSRSEPLPGGDDVVELTWEGADEGDPDNLDAPALLDANTTTPGLWQSDLRLGEEAALVYGIDLEQQRFGSGEIDVSIARPTSGAGAHGSIHIGGRYVRAPDSTVDSRNGDAWWRSHRVLASCTW